MTQRIIELEEALMQWKQRCGELEEEMNQILECSYDGIHVTDGEGCTTHYNAACQRLEKLDRKQVVGRSLSELIEEGLLPDSVSLEAIRTRQTVTRIQNIHGTSVMVTAVPQIRDGRVVRVVTNSRDMTELNLLRRQIESIHYDNEKYVSEIEQLRLKNLKVDHFVYKSKKMQDAVLMALKVATVDSTVLISGETGVGKGVLSRLIHANSKRGNQPFITIDCSSIPENLLESELFGYEGGAFTGASRSGKIGLLEVADKGTVFLDEIGELPLKLQVKLLRVLQDRQIFRVGGFRAIPVDVRFISATHQNLKTMVGDGSFREDLFYRLNVFPICIPPLRERQEDICPLIMGIANRLNEKYQYSRKFDADALELLEQYSWPGNVRELENIVERIIVTADSNLICSCDIPEFIRRNRQAVPNQTDLGQFTSYREAMEYFEKELLKYAIRKGENVAGASKLLKIDPSTVRRKMRKTRDTD